MTTNGGVHFESSSPKFGRHGVKRQAPLPLNEVPRCFLCQAEASHVCNWCRLVSYCSPEHYKYHRTKSKCWPFQVREIHFAWHSSRLKNFLVNNIRSRLVQTKVAAWRQPRPSKEVMSSWQMRHCSAAQYPILPLSVPLAWHVWSQVKLSTVHDAPFHFAAGRNAKKVQNTVQSVPFYLEIK